MLMQPGEAEDVLLLENLKGGGRDRSCRRPRSSMSQVVLLGIVCFCVPGTWNAVTSMAGGIRARSHRLASAATASYPNIEPGGLGGNAHIKTFGFVHSMFGGGVQ